MIFTNYHTESIWAPLLEAEMAQETMRLVEFARYSDVIRERAQRVVDERFLMEELCTQPVFVQHGDFKIESHDGKTPSHENWGPEDHDDSIAKAVAQAIPNSSFFVCFYYTSGHSRRVEILLHGRLNLNQFDLIHEAVDEMIKINRKNIAEQQAGRYTK